MIYFSKLVRTLQSSTFPTPFPIYSTIEQKRNSLAESVEHQRLPPVGQFKGSPPVVDVSFLKIHFPSILLKKYHSLLEGNIPGHGIQAPPVSYKL